MAVTAFHKRFHEASEKGPRTTCARPLGRCSGQRLPWTHWFHGTCQSPNPSHGSSAGPPELVTMTTSPCLLLSMTHLAFSGERLSQPWLTLRRPWSPMDHGALWKKMPLLDIRYAQSTGVL